ncbi:hypothetical protein [Hymenobacter koreensis]|uniref:Uncharacterized protein n=1 Tax=Hymenobacter koreensis TaxID=1084523 RepID=A0ABP8IUG7_9BACT
MLVIECYRIDYPGWCQNEGSEPLRRSEEQPLGLYFGPADPALSGLRVLIANDAEQIEVHLDSRTNLLRAEPDYFGQPAPVEIDSPLHQLLGQPLLQIFLGECAGFYGNLLTTAIRLVFEHDTLTFYNGADEGCYFLGLENNWWGDYTQLYEVEWRDASQWLKLLVAESPGMPHQLV